MSTLKTNTLSNVAGTSSTAIENAIHGSAKAWVNFNGTGTPAIRAQYNVSSITDNGTGDYNVNFTTAMPDANYSVTGCIGGTLGNYAASPYSYDYTTSSFTVEAANVAASKFDYDLITVAIFR